MFIVIAKRKKKEGKEVWFVSCKWWIKMKLQVFPHRCTKENYLDFTEESDMFLFYHKQHEIK